MTMLVTINILEITFFFKQLNLLIYLLSFFTNITQYLVLVTKSFFFVKLNCIFYLAKKKKVNITIEFA